MEQRWSALVEARQRLTSRPAPNVRELLAGGQHRAERGAFDPARGQLGRFRESGDLALRSGETVSEWGRRTGRLRTDGPPLSLGKILRGTTLGLWDDAGEDLSGPAESVLTFRPFRPR